MLVFSLDTTTAEASGDCGDGKAAAMATNAAKTTKNFILKCFCSLDVVGKTTEN